MVSRKVSFQPKASPDVANSTSRIVPAALTSTPARDSSLVNSDLSIINPDTDVLVSVLERSLEAQRSLLALIEEESFPGFATSDLSKPDRAQACIPLPKPKIVGSSEVPELCNNNTDSSFIGFEPDAIPLNPLENFRLKIQSPERRDSLSPIKLLVQDARRDIELFRRKQRERRLSLLRQPYGDLSLLSCDSPVASRTRSHACLSDTNS